ncbi:MAG: hemolysin, partial [Xanthomonadales bacterium]|nr:hemolysin [Xanthomonadales bacterium]
TLNNDGTLTFTPAANYNGPASFDYTVSDGDLTDTGTVNIDVTPVNDAPAAGDDSRTTEEDTPVTIDVVANDTDVDGDNLSVTEVAGQAIAAGETIAVANGQVTLNNDGTLTFTPAANYNGPASFDYTVSDGDLTDTGTVDIDVTAINNAPVANNDSANVAEDQSVTIDVVANDADVEGDDLRVTQIAGRNVSAGDTAIVENGQVTLNDNGTLTFTPVANYNGPASFDYTVSDGDLTDTGTVDIDVTAVNDAPVANTPLANRTNSDGESVNANTAGAFTDVDGDVLTYSATNLPRGLSINATTGVISGTLARDASQVMGGAYNVVVTARDPSGAIGTASFTWNIANVAPAAVADAAATDQNTALTMGDVLANDRDGAGDTDPLTVSQVAGAANNVGAIVAGSAGGTFRINSDGSYTFDPGMAFVGLAAGQSAQTQVTYRVSDGQNGFSDTTLVVTVTGTNDRPTVAGTPVDQVGRDGDTVSIGIADNFGDPDNGDTLTYSATGLPAGLRLDSATGQITGTIDRSASQTDGGTYTVNLTATDGAGASVSSSFVYTITNPAPIAADDTNTTGENTPVTGSVRANDRDGANDTDPLTVDQVAGSAANVGTAVLGSAGGSFIVNADGGYRFDPGTAFDYLAADQTATTAIDYRISDAQGGTSLARLTITVTGANDMPTVVNPLTNVASNDSQSVAIDTAGAFTDVDTNDRLTYTATGLPAGLAFDSATGRISGRLANDASVNSPYTVTITASDGTATAQSSFTWRINNLAATANDDTGMTGENTALTVNAASGVLANDRDLDGDLLRVAQVNAAADNVGNAVRGANGGQFTLNADGSYRFDPGMDFEALAVGETRTTSVSYQVSDDQGSTSMATLSITVTGTNDAPVVDAPLPDASNNDGQMVTLVTAGAFRDVDTNDRLSYTATGLPDGVMIDAATGVISGRLASDASVRAPYNVTVTATDEAGQSVTSTFTWAIANLAATANDDSASTSEDVAFSRNAASGVLANDRDLDDDPLTVVRVADQPERVGQAVAGTNAGLFTIGADGRYSFDPNGAFNDLAVGASRDTSVTYQISDGQGSTSTATLTVTVTGTNDGPTVVQPVADQSARDGDRVRLATAGAFADVDRGDVLSYSVTGLPAGLAIDTATGLITGTLDRSASQVNGGRYAVTVTATDDNGAQVSDTFDYVVTNPVPMAVDDTATTSENVDLSGSVLANDRDGVADTDPLTVDRVNGQAEAVGRGVAGSAGGVFTLNADGSYTFDPGTDFDALAVGQSAMSRVGYRISDGQGGSDTAQLTVTVTGTNDTPTVARALDDLSASNTETITIPTANAFADVDTGDTLTFTAEGLPDGLMIDAGTGEISGQLAVDAAARGPFNIRVTATDRAGAMASDAFVLTVNDLPITAMGDTDTTDQDTVITREQSTSVLANDGDTAQAVSRVNGSADNVGMAIAGTNGGLFTVFADGTYRFEPDDAFDRLQMGETDTTSVVYEVANNGGGTDTARLIITVAGVNDVPIGDNVPLAPQRALDGDTVAIATADGFVDPDSDPLTYAAAGLPAGLSIDAATGVVRGTLTSDASQNGPGNNGRYTIAVTATDPSGGNAYRGLHAGRGQCAGRGTR